MCLHSAFCPFLSIMYRSHSNLGKQEKKFVLSWVVREQQGQAAPKDEWAGARGWCQPRQCPHWPGMVLQHLSVAGRGGCWKQGPPAAPSRVPSGAAGDRAADRTGDVAATRVWGVHVGHGGLGTDTPTASLGQGLGAQAWAEMGLQGPRQRVWVGVPGEAGRHR